MTWASGATTEMYLYSLFHANGGIILPSLTSKSCLGTDASGNIITGTCGGTSAFSALTGGTNTTAAMLVGSGASLGPTGTGTIQATNIASTVAVSSPITVTGSGTVGSPYTIACPTCGTSSGGTNVSQNSGSAETNLPITGFMPQFCSDTSGSGTAQSCTVANTFVPQTGNTIVYSTTTTNSGTGLTINVNSLGAKSVAIPGSSGWTTTLTANIIPANKPLILSYDGTNWNVQQTGTAVGGGGAMVKISSQTLASPAATMTFSSLPATYTSLKFIFHAISANVGADSIVLTFNSVPSNGYRYTCMGQSTSNSPSNVNNSNSGNYIVISDAAPYTPATGGTLDIFDYTSNFPMFRSDVVWNKLSIGVSTENCVGFPDASSGAVSTITFQTSSGSNLATGTTFTLYGIQ